MGILRHMDLRDLPSVDALTSRLRERWDLPPPLVRAVARDAVDQARAALQRGVTAGEPEEEAALRLSRVAAGRPARIINATGVLLHTNLGRAPLGAPAADAAMTLGRHYGNVEFDLGSGRRGGRGHYTSSLLAALVGAEAGLAVNNNAAGLVLALAALAPDGGRVVVSRGELIEIGGSFRLPDLMHASGVSLVEVGTTNRTRLEDYASVEGPALFLKVHPANYRVEGFAEDVTYADLGDLARRRGVAFVADVGSGLLDTRTPWLMGPPPAWLAGEPGVRQTLVDGADVVLFSGDKLLGGPQAGAVVGSRDLVDRMRRHPLARAFRTSGLVDTLLAATLETYAHGTAGMLPFWRMAALELSELTERHEAVLARSGVTGRVVTSGSVPGAGSVPGEEIPSPAIEVPDGGDAAWTRLLASETPILGRRRGGSLLVDLRTVDPDDDDAVTAALTGLR